jgi:hypothetical protein
MINSTSLNEAYYTLLKEIYTTLFYVSKTTLFFALRTETRLFSSKAPWHSRPTNIKMKYSIVEDVMASFPHPIFTTVEGEPDYQTIHTTRKFLQANLLAIDTHLGGRTLGHLGLIILDAFLFQH